MPGNAVASFSHPALRASGGAWLRCPGGMQAWEAGRSETADRWRVEEKLSGRLETCRGPSAGARGHAALSVAFPVALDAPRRYRSASLSARWSAGEPRISLPEARTQRSPRHRGGLPTTRRGLARPLRLGFGVSRRSRGPLWKPHESLTCLTPSGGHHENVHTQEGRSKRGAADGTARTRDPGLWIRGAPADRSRRGHAPGERGKPE